MPLDAKFLALLKQVNGSRPHITEDESLAIQEYMSRVITSPGQRLPKGKQPFDILARDDGFVFGIGKGFSTYVHKAIELNTHPDFFLTLLQTCASVDPEFFSRKTVATWFSRDGFGSYAYKYIMQGVCSPDLLRIILVCTDAGKEAYHHFVYDSIDEGNPGYTRIHAAADKGNARLLETLLEPYHGEVEKLLSAKDSYGKLPIHYAAQSNNPDVIDIMLFYVRRESLSAFPAPKAVGSDVVQPELDAQAANHTTQAALALIPPDEPALALAKEKIVTLAMRRANQSTNVVLYAALKKTTTAQKCTTLGYLKSLLGDERYMGLAMSASEFGRCVLHILASHDDVIVFRYFLDQFNQSDQTAMLLRQNMFRYMPVHVAAYEGHNEIFQLCLQRLGKHAVAAVSQRVALLFKDESSTLDYDYQGTLTLLHLVCRHGSTDSVAALLACEHYDVVSDMEYGVRGGYSPNNEAGVGATALHYAVMYGGAARVRLFTEAGLIHLGLLRATSWYVPGQAPNAYHTFLGFVSRYGDPESLTLLLDAIKPKEAYTLLINSPDSLYHHAANNQRYRNEMRNKLTVLTQKYKVAAMGNTVVLAPLVAPDEVVLSASIGHDEDALPLAARPSAAAQQAAAQQAAAASETKSAAHLSQMWQRTIGKQREPVVTVVSVMTSSSSASPTRNVDM